MLVILIYIRLTLTYMLVILTYIFVRKIKIYAHLYVRIYSAPHQNI